MVRRGRTGNERRLLLASFLDGQAGAARHLSRALSREWLPLTLALIATKRRRQVALLVLLIDALPPPPRARPRDVLPTLGLWAIDRGAYAAGLWLRTARRRDGRALLPRLL